MSQLPAGSRLMRAEVPSAAWTTTDHLLANIIDSLAWNTWLLAAVNSKKPPPKPKPMPRPGAEAKPAKREGPSALYQLAMQMQAQAQQQGGDGGGG